MNNALMANQIINLGFFLKKDPGFVQEEGYQGNCTIKGNRNDCRYYNIPVVIFS
jgi:hypothetical protein